MDPKLGAILTCWRPDDDDDDGDNHGEDQGDDQGDDHERNDDGDGDARHLLDFDSYAHFQR